MVYCLFIIGVFFSGMLVAINLSGLIVVNTAYEFSWWKVILAVLLAVFCGAAAFCEASLISRRLRNK